MTKFEKACAGCVMLLLLAIVLGMCAAVSGCIYRGAKVTEGTDLAIGLNIPCSEGMLQLQVLNYLSGFRVGVDRNANLTVRYYMTESNDYFGVVHTRVQKKAFVKIEPVDIGLCETNAVETCACGDNCQCAR